MEHTFFHISQKEPVLLITCPWTSALQKYEKTLFYCKSLSLQHFITAVPSQRTGDLMQEVRQCSTCTDLKGLPAKYQP
jgi:hypothetical protein